MWLGVSSALTATPCGAEKVTEPYRGRAVTKPPALDGKGTGVHDGWALGYARAGRGTWRKPTPAMALTDCMPPATHPRRRGGATPAALQASAHGWLSCCGRLVLRPAPTPRKGCAQPHTHPLRRMAGRCDESSCAHKPLCPRGKYVATPARNLCDACTAAPALLRRIVRSPGTGPAPALPEPANNSLLRVVGREDFQSQRRALVP
jgi:hypothetical protein